MNEKGGLECGRVEGNCVKGGLYYNQHFNVVCILYYETLVYCACSVVYL